MDQETILEQIGACYVSYNNKTAQDARELYGSLDDPNCECMGKPILLYTASRGDSAGVETLLSAGADAMVRDGNDCNALHKLAYADPRDYAIWADDGETARLLLDAGCSVVRKDVDGSTCLHLAAERGKANMVKEIVAAGKKLDIADRNGRTALHLACESAVRAADSFHRYERPRYEQTVVQQGDGSEQQKTALAQKQAQAKAEYDKGMAEADALLGIVECLLDAGLDPELKDSSGKTAKDIAANCMDLRIPSLLNGTWAEDGNQSEERQDELRAKGMELMQAVEKKDYDAAEALLKTGADPNSLYGGELCFGSMPLQGKAPLAMACIFLDTQMANLLLDHSADPGLKDADGNIPLAYCFAFEASFSFKALEDKAIETILDAMVGKGLALDSEANEKGNTLLNLACRAEDSALRHNGQTVPGQAVRRLLRHKANPNIPDNSGVTPLMRVCKGNTSSMEDIQLSLLEAGADVAARDGAGATPLIYAAQNKDHALARAMADMLFSFGEPAPDAVDNSQKTALDYAGEANNEGLVSYLLMKM